MFHIVEVFLADFPHCGIVVGKQVALSTFKIISYDAFHILEDITVFQAFLPQNCFTYITFTIHIIDNLGYCQAQFQLTSQVTSRTEVALNLNNTTSLK